MPKGNYRSAEQFALVEKFFEDLEAGKRIFEFQQFLLRQVLYRQHFRDAETDPFSIVEMMRLGNARRAHVFRDSPIRP